MRPTALLVLLFAGCSVGPDYEKPPAPVPAAFKELQGWKPATPADGLEKGAWWEVYHDPLLDRLERQVEVKNQTLAQAAAAYREARAAIAEAQASLYPVATVTPTVTRNSSTVASTGGGAVTRHPKARTEYSLEGNASWDVDLWGRIRRSVEGNVAAAQASAADLANARLSAQGALAIAYFQMLGADELRALLDRTAAADQRALDIVQNQYNAGVAARSDLITAQTQVLTTQAAAISAGVARAQDEHAIAVLTGVPPSELSIPPATLPTEVPVVPARVPARLLERRPDIAAAERTMQQQNAQIGVAVAGYYPDISLTALFGYAGNPVGSLIKASNQVWSLGASATETVFSGLSTPAQVAAAHALYDEAVAGYRQTVLTAFQQVEDQLSSLRILQLQDAAEAEAVRAANEAVAIALNEYQAGVQAYTAVVTAQNTALANEESALTVHIDRLVASVALIEALGGGWDATELPSAGILRGKGLLPQIP